MKSVGRPLALGLVLLAWPAANETETPNTLKDAVEQGFGVVGAVPQGPSNQDHVLYLQKDGRLIICGFRVVLAAEGFDSDPANWASAPVSNDPASNLLLLAKALCG